MSAKQESHKKSLVKELGEIGFEYRGKTGNDHLVFHHPDTGPLFTSSKDDPRNRNAALRNAQKLIISSTQMSSQFIRWLFNAHEVLETEKKVIKDLDLSKEASEFIWDTGQRGSPSSLVDSVRKSEQIRMLKANTYEFVGPLYGKEIILQPDASEPVITDSKPIQLVHRFNDTTKMVLTRAGITTVSQLEPLTLDELSKVKGLGRVRIREIWDFFGRADPYDTNSNEIYNSALPRQTKNILLRNGTNSFAQLKELSPDSLLALPKMSELRVRGIWKFLDRKDDPFVATVAPPAPAPELALAPPVTLQAPTVNSEPLTDDAAVLMQQLRNVLVSQSQSALQEERDRTLIAREALVSAQKEAAWLGSRLAQLSSQIAEAIALTEA